MANSNLPKVTVQTITNTKPTIQPKAKVSPSKFDQVRSKMDRPSATHSQSASQDSLRVGASERAEFKKRLEEVRQRDLDEIFKADLRQSKTQVDAVRQKLSTQPDSPALERVKARLLQVENQYLESGRLLRGLGKLDSPEDYLKMQAQMYQLVQNIELLSKVVGEVVGGVNKILSTQV